MDGPVSAALKSKSQNGFLDILESVIILCSLCYNSFIIHVCCNSLFYEQGANQWKLDLLPLELKTPVPRWVVFFHICMYIFADVHTSMHIYMHPWKQTLMHTHLHTCAYTHIRVVLNLLIVNLLSEEIFSCYVIALTLPCKYAGQPFVWRNCQLLCNCL